MVFNASYFPEIYVKKLRIAPMSAILPIIAGAAVAGFIQGASGFAFALIATAIWVWHLEPAQLVPLVLTCSLISHVTSMRLLGRNILATSRPPLLVGGAIGVPIGLYLFTQVDVQGFKFAVGMILIVTCTTMLLATRLPTLRQESRSVEGLVGLASGVMGGLGGLSGPVPVIWTTLSGWDKQRQRAAVQPLLMLIGILALTAHTVQDGIDGDTVLLAVLAVPIVIASSWAGRKAFDLISEAIFRHALIMLLLLTGLSLIAPALLS